MRTAITCCLLALTTVAASAAALNWDPNPSTEMVTNYVVQASGPSTSSFSVGVATSFDLAVLPGGTWTLTVLAQNSAGTSDPSAPFTYNAPLVPGPVSGIVITANWSAGAFDILAQWQPGANAATYTVNLVNTATGAGVPRSVSTTSTVWTRIPSGSYRFTVNGVSGSGVAGPVSTVNLGSIRPGRPQNLR